MYAWERRNNEPQLSPWVGAAIPLLGMVTGIVWAVAFIYITRQITKVRLKKLELKELELRARTAEG